MEEISFIHTTVQRLENETRQTNAHRVSLLRRLNQLQPTSRNLPPETLALIFYQAISGAPTFIFSLAAVCTEWHRIAWTTPALWTLTLTIPLKDEPHHRDAALLRLYFTNVHALPVNLRIMLDKFSPTFPTLSQDILSAAFLENSEKIGTLTCTSRSPISQAWAAMVFPKLSTSSFPNLERLEIALRAPFHDRLHKTTLFPNVPKLRTVILRGYCPLHETFWPQLTALRLSSLPISQSLQILIKCPCLIEFRCSSPSQAVKPVNSVMHTQRIMTLKNLEIFEWTGALNDWDIFLYTFVRIPNLRRMTLGNTHPLTRPGNTSATVQNTLWKDFFRHFGVITMLELSVFRFTQEWFDIFDIVGVTLQELHIVALGDVGQISQLLRELSFVYNSNRCYLPHLRILHAKLELRLDLSTELLDFLCSRRIRPLVPKDHDAEEIFDFNDWFFDPYVDLQYWESHTRLERAVIECWPLGFKFKQSDWALAEFLKKSGLRLDLSTQRFNMVWE